MKFSSTLFLYSCHVIIHVLSYFKIISMISCSRHLDLRYSWLYSTGLLGGNNWKAIAGTKLKYLACPFSELQRHKRRFWERSVQWNWLNFLLRQNVSLCFDLLTPVHVIEAKIKGDYNAGLIIAQRYHQL